MPDDSRGSSASVHPKIQQPLFTFTQGVVVGQASILFLLALFLRYVIFESSSKSKDKEQLAAANHKSRTRKKKKRRASLVLPAGDLHLLQRLDYDINSHSPESSSWLNALVAQAISGYRTAILNSNAEEGGARGYVEKMLNQGRAPGENPSFISLDSISVGDVDFGDDFPVMSNARVRPSEKTGRIRIEVDVDYSDHVALSLDTKVVINFPTPRFAVLPISLGITLARFQATLTLEILIESLTSPPVLHIALLPDFVLDLQTTSLIGSTAKLQDIPKIEQLLAARLRAFIVARWVLPRSKAIRLPDLGPGATDNSNTPQPEDDWVEIESGDVPQPLSDSQPAPGYREADADQSAPQLRGHHKPISVAEWRRTQPSFVTPQPAYMPPWAPGSPLFSPNSSLTATSYARPPPSIPKSASEFSLPGQLPNSVRHRRPQQGLSTPNYRVPPSIMQSRQSSANPISRSWPRGGSPTELDEMGG